MVAKSLLNSMRSRTVKPRPFAYWHERIVSENTFTLIHIVVESSLQRVD